MTKFDKLFATKFDELKERERFLKSAECNATDNTKSSQLNKVRREQKTLRLIEELVHLLPESTKLANDEHLHNMLTLVAERQSAIHFECQVGDKLVDLLKKYSTMNKLMQRMQTYCDKHELGIDWEKNVIVTKQELEAKQKEAAVKKAAAKATAGNNK